MAAGYIYKDGKFDPVGAMDIPGITNRLDELEAANFVRSVNGVSADAAGQVDIASVASSWSMPGNKHQNLTLGASGTTYTAPADGWFVFAKVMGGATRYNSLQNTTSQIQADAIGSTSEMWGRCYVPCREGDVVKVDYNSSGETKIFMFVYAEGAE